MRAYRIGEAARRSGLSEAVIRAWERRYRVLEPARTPGGYRVFSERDIALLRRLRRLTQDGMAIREAAALASPARTSARGARRANGIQVARWRYGMLAAAARLDQGGIERVLDAAFAVLTPLEVYDELIVRLDREVGARMSRGTPGRAQQHLASQVVRARLLGSLRGGGRTRGQVVCACLPDEEHDLGLLGAALRFRAHAFRVTFLGARTPIEHLAHVVRRLRAARVALACVTDPGAAGLRRTLAAVARALPPGTACVIGGGAAVLHGALCARAGILVIDGDGAWRRALAAPRSPRRRGLGEAPRHS
jgi:DNA-binding transcriptional MerR regulator